jgi:CheY-like chemotaxis protein
MESPLILVIDDSPTIRKMVECHLSQSGYRVALATDADAGVAMAREVRPDLILLDHQLPGTTGDEVCRRLLESEETAHTPVVVSSAMRNRAFAHYAEFPNVVDQIPKPFTPELLKSGVANALEMGALVIKAQRSGGAMPETVGEHHDAALEGHTGTFPARAVLDFLNNGEHGGRLTLEVGKDRIRFTLGGGRIQAVVSPTAGPDRLAPFLPPEMADLAPLLAITLAESQDASMSGLVRLLERSLSDPRRLRTLLRFQAAVLTHRALTGEPGKFAFEPRAAMPPMFQAFPLQVSLPALAVEGVRRCEPPADLDRWRALTFARQAARGGNLDRSGLSAQELRIHSLLDGSQDLAGVAQKAGLELSDVVDAARGFELAGLVERRTPTGRDAILLLEDDPETIHVVQKVLGPEGEGYPLKVARDRVSAQLLLRRTPFAMVMMALDRGDHEAFYRTAREQCPAGTRFVGVLTIEDEGELARLDAMGLDGVIHRPASEADLRTIARHLLTAHETAGVS